MHSSAPASSDSLLRHPSSVAFWLSRTGSGFGFGFGFQMLSIVVSWQIYTMTGRAFDLGLIGLAQFLPSVLPALVPPSMLARAMAANAASGEAAMMVGPALGGFLYVAGAGTVYIAIGALYLLSIAMVARLRYEQAPPKRVPASFATLFAGVRFIRARPIYWA